MKDVLSDAARVTRPGPGSVSWRINGERAAVLGWGRAILLQLAHPLVAEGVAAHSTFRGGPQSSVVRFHATVRAMLALTFGTETEARATVARIRGIHDRVNGALPHAAGTHSAGAPYSAHDPLLLAWVHLTLVDSMPLAYSRFVSALGEPDVSAYATESRWATALIGAPADDLPLTAADVRIRMRAMLEGGALAVTDTARELARSVVYPPLGWVTGPFGRVHALAALGDLPPEIRREYGFEWSASDERALDRWSRRVRAWSGAAPAVLRRRKHARRAESMEGAPDR